MTLHRLERTCKRAEPSHESLANSIDETEYAESESSAAATSSPESGRNNTASLHDLARSAEKSLSPYSRTIARLVQAIHDHCGLTEVEIADIVGSEYIDHDSAGVFDEGTLYQYDPLQGLYIPLQKSTIANFVYDLNGTSMPDKNEFKTSARLASNVFIIVCDRHAETGFFRDAQHGVTVANGFVLIRDGKIILEAFSADQAQRHRVPIALLDDAECPMTDEFLLRTLGDEEKVRLVYEIAGVALLGLGSKFQRAFVLIGPGSDGKSVILSLIKKLMPVGAFSAISPGELEMDYQRVPLARSRLNAVGEFRGFNEKSWSQLKAVITGDPISVRVPGCAGSEICPKALHLFCTNKLQTKLPETGNAVERRLRLIRCSNTVSERDADRNLADRLFNAEAQGILRRALEAASGVISRGCYTDPQSVRLETLGWIASPATVFIREGIVETRDQKDRVKASDLHNACVDFCRKNKLLPPNERDLASALHDAGYESKKSSSMWWIGLKLVDGFQSREHREV